MGPTEKTDDKLEDLEDISLEEEAKYIRKTSTWDGKSDRIISMTTEYFLEAPPPEPGMDKPSPWAHVYPVHFALLMLAGMATLAAVLEAIFG